MKPPVYQTGGELKAYKKTAYSPPGLALALRVVGILTFPATLSETLIRSHLVYPLASLDVSGQWPVYLAAAWPNEGSVCLSTIPLC